MKKTTNMSPKNLYPILFTLLIVALTASCGRNASEIEEANELTPEEARAIAKEAYIYTYPMADGYRIQYAYFVDQNNPEFKTAYNDLFNTARVYTPDDKAVQTPNSDTPYSFAGLDLRSEPYVITIPEMEKERYFSIQLIDYYTHNFDYLGSRTSGNGGGNYLIAGPNWKGETPPGISKVLQSETELLIALIRTQLFDSKDLENVKKIQEGYRLQPLSEYLGQSPPAPAAQLVFPTPLSPAEQKVSPEIFNILNFQLQFCPTHPSETELMARFAKIGIGPGQNFDFKAFPSEIQEAINLGISDAWTEYEELKKRVDQQEITSGDLFGTRDYLNNNYLYRMAGAIIGIYGNSKAEAMYPIYSVDSEGNLLHGDKKYAIKFDNGQEPPASGFWSLTMYELPSSLLVSNPLDRYLINSAMLPNLKKDPDGGFTLYIQNSSPGKSKESNWLPAPKGSFVIVMRIYWPKEEALNGTWIRSEMVKVD
jgi:hypothetical protein